MPIRIMPGEVTPTLFVGLGGSGGKAVGRIAKRLQSHQDFKSQYDNLVKFVAIDTNDADLKKLRTGSSEFGTVDQTVLISDFDKAAYSELRRGGSFEHADEYFTQWVHPHYKFREESGAGAGQIRIESRLSFFRAIETGEAGAVLKGLVSELRSHAHGMRAQSASIQAFVYFSVAGGTGSGAFLPFAYYLRDIIADRSARMVGFAILPEAFEQVVGLNIDGIQANGYAALKEAEHLMKLDANVPPEDVTLHYDPRNKQKTQVERRPYDLLYLIDRPEDFSLARPDDALEALSDATYLQIFSPIIGEQQADYDNYTKENRRLFPDSLWDHGTGYTAFYGTIGASVLVLPRQDLLHYCARRYAATAVRRFVLLDDPTLVSERQRADFKQITTKPKNFDQLADEAKAELLDEMFCKKIRLLANQQDLEGGFWSRVVDLPSLVSDKLGNVLEEMRTSFREKAGKVRINPNAIDERWTPAASADALGKQLEEARGAIELEVDAALDRIRTGDWWSDFLAKAGPDAAPALSLYEQRFVLIQARDGGPLASSAIDELQTKVRRLRSESDLGPESRFRKDMQSMAAELKDTKGGWDKLILRKDKDFEEARDRAIGACNEFVDRARASVIESAMAEIIAALSRGAEHLLRTFRDIEAEGGRLARDVEERAHRYEMDGGDDGVASEANDYALDVEVLQHFNGSKRFWSWYYADQIARRASMQDQKSVLNALREATRPRTDERGNRVVRDPGDVVREIVELVEQDARGRLSGDITGDASSEDASRKHGLRLDDALILEAAYYDLYEDNPHAPPEDLLPATPMDVSKLRSEERIGIYLRKKIEYAIAKAQPLSRYEPENRGSIKHPSMCLVGMHDSLEGGLFEDVLKEATKDKHQTVLWSDSHRIVFYNSILGVPIYCFPHVNEDMKAAYQRFQRRPAGAKAWPLHIDHHWEDLPDLDPEDLLRKLESQAAARRGTVLALALGISDGTVIREGDAWALKVREDKTFALGAHLIEAADALGALEEDENMGGVFMGFVAPLLAKSRRSGEDDEVKRALQGVLKQWNERRMNLEVDGQQTGAEYPQLVEASKLAQAAVG